MWEQYKYSALPLTLEGSTQSAKSDAANSWSAWCCHIWITCLSFLLLLLTLPISIWCFLKIVPDYERIVVFRLGRVRPPKGPGLVLLLPLIDQFRRIDMRTRAFSIQPCKVKSQDDVPVSVGADVQFRVCNPILSVLSVQDLNFVIQNTAHNLLGQSMGRKYLREIYGDRTKLGEHYKEDINEQVKPWGVCVERVNLLVEAALRTHEEHVNVPLTPQVGSPNAGLEQMIIQFVSMANQVSATDDKPSPAVPELSLQDMLSRLEGTLSESLVSEMKSSYQLYVIHKDGKRSACFLDLTSVSGLSDMGVLTSPPDVTLEVTEADLLSLIQGDLTPMTAFTTGRLHVTGNLRTALRLEKIVPDYERIVVFRLGRVRPPKGPGLVLLLPLIDQFRRIDMRTRAFSIQPCKVKSRDDVPVSVGADVQFRVCNPILSVLSVQDLNFVIQSTAHNLLGQSMGRKYLREIYGDRTKLGEHYKEDINEQVKPWGVCVERVNLLVEAALRTHEEHVNVPLTPQVGSPNAGLEQMIIQFVSMANQVSATDDKPSPAVPELSLQDMLSRLEGTLLESLVSEMKSSYQLYVIHKDGKRSACFLDLTSGSGLSGMGVLTSPPDVTLEVTEADLLSLIQGDLTPMTAFTTGRLHVTGNLRTALRLEKVLRKITNS